jgi:hypothetical protein
VRAEARAHRDLDDLARELSAQPASVEADDDAALARIAGHLDEVGHQARRRAADDREVHPVGPRPQHTAQARGPEFEPTREAIRDLGPCLGGEERLELLAGFGARIVGQPSFGACAQSRHIDHARIEACGRVD